MSDHTDHTQDNPPPSTSNLTRVPATEEAVAAIRAIVAEVNAAKAADREFDIALIFEQIGVLQDEIADPDEDRKMSIFPRGLLDELPDDSYSIAVMSFISDLGGFCRQVDRARKAINAMRELAAEAGVDLVVREGECSGAN